MPVLHKRFGPPIFWAGFTGFLLGILFSVTVWATNRIVQIRTTLPDEAGAISDSGSHLTLGITSPASGSVVGIDTVTISGTTSVPSIIVISGGTADAVTEPGTTKFSTPYKLKEGENEVTVTAVDSFGNEASSVLNILYSTEKIQ